MWGGLKLWMLISMLIFTWETSMLWTRGAQEERLKRVAVSVGVHQDDASLLMLHLSATWMNEREREGGVFGSLSNINLGSGDINHFWNFPVFSCCVFFSYIVSGIIFMTFFFTTDNMVIWETLHLFFTPLLFIFAVIGHVTILWLFGFS